MRPRSLLSRTTLLLVTTILPAGCASGGSAGGVGPRAPSPSEEDAPAVIRPGAPGEASRAVEAERISELSMPEGTPADAEFMAGMIHHHAQALQMTALIPERSTSPAIHRMGLRMEISQRDEIRLMQGWLERRGLEAPQVVLEAGPRQGDMAMHGGMEMMPGMLSPAQMRELREAAGDRFDQLFLEYMIQHHRGALVMVDELFATPGAGQESQIFQFADDVDADQRAEIDRMAQLLAHYR